MELFIDFIAYILFWVAVYVGRDKNSKVKLFSKDWFICLFLSVLMVALIKYKY